MKEVFAQDGDCRKLAARLYFDRYYPDAGLLATLLDNHDLDRFITTCGGDLRKYKLALAFMLTSRGIPVLCYGDEVPLAGEHGKKPYNRRSMVFDTKSEMFQFTKGLISLRKSSEALRRGIQCHIHADKDTYVFGRLTENQLALVAINNSENNAYIDVPMPFEIQNNVKVLKSVCGINSDFAFLDGRLKVSLPPKSFSVCIPHSQDGFYFSAYKEYKQWLLDEKTRGTVLVTFRAKIKYIPGINAKFFLTGSCDELGNWDSVTKALKMAHCGKNIYEVSVRMPVDKIFECKCFYKIDGKTVWQEGDNSIFRIKKTGTEFLFIDWKNE